MLDCASLTPCHRKDFITTIVALVSCGERVAGSRPFGPLGRRVLDSQNGVYTGDERGIQEILGLRWDSNIRIWQKVRNECLWGSIPVHLAVPFLYAPKGLGFPGLAITRWGPPLSGGLDELRKARDQHDEGRDKAARYWARADVPKCEGVCRS